MATSERSALIGPTAVGAIRRFHRIVLFTTIVSFFLGVFWYVLSPSEYAGKAAIIITPLPASLTVGLGTAHVSATTFSGQQVAIIETTPSITDRAASIVNSKFPAAHLTGPQIAGALAIKLPVPGTTGSNGAATRITVTLPNATYAPAAANAVVTAYLEYTQASVGRQANDSIKALKTEIAQTTAGIEALPAPTRTTSTTVPKTPTTRPQVTPTTRAPHTTTTRPPHTTTTRPARTTTTRPPHTTTTSPTTSTARARPIGIDLTAYRRTAPKGTVTLAATATTTTLPAATTTTLPTTTPTTSPSSTTGSGDASAQQRAALQSTLSNLNRDEAQIRVNQDIDQVFRPTIFPATAPGTPANGNFFRTLALFVVPGFVLGAAIAFVLASTRRRFERATDPQRLYGAPLITTVPAFEIPAWSRVALPVLTAPADEAAEAYRIMATVLRSRRGESDCLVVAFSAADLGAGTTTTVANCGLALAEMGERVLVVDGDPLGKGLTQTLVDQADPSGLTASPLGLSELLEGRSLNDTIVPALGNTGLMVVPSGQSSEVAVHRWRSSTLRMALENLTEHYDIILLDTPPMGTSSFSLDLSGIAEHLVLVIPHFDLVDLHEVIARRLPVVGIELLGYVYNGTSHNVRFAPYFPVVRGQSAGPALGSGPTVPPPPPVPTSPLAGAAVSSHTTPVASSRIAPPAPAPASGSSHADDTGVVPAVAPSSLADTGQVPAVPARDDDTGIFPIVPGGETETK